MNKEELPKRKKMKIILQIKHLKLKDSLVEGFLFLLIYLFPYFVLLGFPYTEQELT
jgi:hypothetical protein